MYILRIEVRALGAVVARPLCTIHWYALLRKAVGSIPTVSKSFFLSHLFYVELYPSIIGTYPLFIEHLTGMQGLNPTAW